MTLSISSAFDGGNIRLVSIADTKIDLEIVKDNQSEFHQWFYFRLSGAAGRAVELRLTNCGDAAYPLVKQVLPGAVAAVLASRSTPSPTSTGGAEQPPSTTTTPPATATTDPPADSPESDVTASADVEGGETTGLALVAGGAVAASAAAVALARRGQRRSASPQNGPVGRGADGIDSSGG